MTKEVFSSSKTAPRFQSLYACSMFKWKEHLLDELKEKLNSSIMQTITRERNGEQISQDLIFTAISSYIKVGVTNKDCFEYYRENFESFYISSSCDFYLCESSSVIAAKGVSEYMILAERRLEEESRKSKKYLPLESREKVRKEIERVLVGVHLETLLSEAENFFKNESSSDLSRMYKLLMTQGAPSMKPLLNILEGYIFSFGMDKLKELGLLSEKEIRDPNISRTYFELLYQVYIKFHSQVNVTFFNDPQFLSAFERAFRKIVNHPPFAQVSPKPAELLAKFADLMLKKSAKKDVEENVVEETLSQLISLFKYLDDKDVFQKFYSKAMAKRLISGSSLSDDAESFMVGQLKQMCGYEYSAKFQKMLNDINNMSELNEKFTTFLTNNKKETVDFSVMVLTSGSWPMPSQPPPFITPPELEECTKLFEEFYVKSHQGRKLTWFHNLSKGEVDITVEGWKRHKLHASSHQISILLLFNSSTLLSFSDILKIIGMKENDLKRNLMSLVEAKLIQIQDATSGVIESSPSLSSITSSSNFLLNPSFTSKFVKIRLNPVVITSEANESDDTYKGLQDDRNFVVQATIVRIMKARLRLDHANLVSEVYADPNLRFKPEISLIKKALESLIEKEYLKRIDTNKYEYLA
eukprot:TRINITY_DN3455_c0_g1_i1.p1 TRINITY_DN3455_c0_g1~~TRINITY_DN3455_c0_g1_i1.p1  ORF type:complete len:640 (-),score=159.80 TRINITY_DN3455_c0_g1_i1:66-1985(-)